MVMRASKTERIGTAGQSRVKADFEDLEWGVNPNHDHDLGTDLWLQARDGRRFDLGALVGVQVKSSDDVDGSYFSRPAVIDNLEGWWYSESKQDHFKYWTEHVVPHLLVLHDHETSSSYWVHVTKDKVIGTGRGAKIFVPATQTVDAEHRDELIAIATSKRPGTSWAGSAWSSRNKIYLEDRIRYAMIAPRLVAPHPNAMPNTLEPEQAVAMLVQLRLHELNSSFDLDRRYPTLDEAKANDDWRWRLYADLYEYIRGGDPDIFANLLVTCEAPHELAAAVVMQASCFIEHGRYHEAQKLLLAVLERDTLSPADNSWVQVQLARCLSELGDTARAQRLSVEIQRQRSAVSEDPTLEAICGAAVDVIFASAPLGVGNVGEAIVGRDIPIAWWRSQTLSTALLDRFAIDFKQWSADESVTFGKADTAWLKLRSVTLTTGFTGDHSNWRHSFSLLAQQELMTHDESASVEQVASSLRDLRWAGDKAAIEKATRRIVLDGPAVAAQVVAHEVDLDRSTRTSVRGDLALLIQAADVFDTRTADRSVKWTLKSLADPSRFLERHQPTFMLDHETLRLLAAAVPAASVRAQREVIEHLIGLRVQEDQHLARLYSKVFKAIEPAMWTKNDLERVTARPIGDSTELASCINQIAASTDAQVLENALVQLREGSIAALDSIPDWRVPKANDVKPVIAALRERLLQQRNHAHRGMAEIGGPDFTRALVCLNMWHPRVADWEPIIELFSDPLIAARAPAGALHLLASMPSMVPATVAQRIVDVLDTCRNTSHANHHFEDSDISGLIAEALDALGPDALSSDALWSLLTGNPDQRASAALVVARRRDPACINLLVSLTRDEDAGVRATVAGCLAGWLCDGVATAEVTSHLQRLLRDSGTRLAKSISRTLENMRPENSHGVDAITELLRAHISTTARQQAKGIRGFEKL